MHKHDKYYSQHVDGCITLKHKHYIRYMSPYYYYYSSMKARVGTGKKALHDAFPSVYDNRSLCKAWQGDQGYKAFCLWCDNTEGFNLFDKDGRRWQLDKDFLSTGNNLYSPVKCCFIPQSINSMIKPNHKGKVTNDKYRTICKGVTESKTKDGVISYRVSCCGKYLGKFSDLLSARIAYDNHFKLNLKIKLFDYFPMLDERVLESIVKMIDKPLIK